MPAPDTRPRLVVLTEAALYTGRHRATLRRWIAEGKITGYRRGKLIEVDLAELDRLAEPIPPGGDGDAA